MDLYKLLLLSRKMFFNEFDTFSWKKSKLTVHLHKNYKKKSNARFWRILESKSCQKQNNESLIVQR